MSMLHLTIIDDRHSLWGKVHGRFAHLIFALLENEPLNIPELRDLSLPFESPDGEKIFDTFEEGICTEFYDAGVMIVDLRENVIVAEQEYFTFESKGKAELVWNDGQYVVGESLPYNLENTKWLLFDNIDDWQATCGEIVLT